MQGVLYLATVLDVFSRRIVGWQMSDRMTTDLVLSAFEMALWRRDVVREHLVHHSDSEYLRGVLLGVLTLTVTDVLDDRVARCPRAS